PAVDRVSGRWRIPTHRLRAERRVPLACASGSTRAKFRGFQWCRSQRNMGLIRSGRRWTRTRCLGSLVRRGRIRTLKNPPKPSYGKFIVAKARGHALRFGCPYKVFMIELEVYASGVGQLEKILELDHELEAVPG